MSRPQVPKVSLKAVERKRHEVDSQRALLHRTLRDAPSIEDALVSTTKALDGSRITTMRSTTRSSTLTGFCSKRLDCVSGEGSVPATRTAPLLIPHRGWLLSALLALPYTILGS
jgi:hypothetical protein